MARTLNESQQLLIEALKPYRLSVVLGLLSLILVDSLEVLPAVLLKKGVDLVHESQFTMDETERKLLWIALGYFGVSLIQGLCRYAWRIFLVRSSMFAGRDIRNRLVLKMLRLLPDFHHRNRVGNLMSLSTSDVDTVRMALGPGLLTFADAFFYFITVPIAMFLMSWKLAVLSLIPVLFLPFVVMKLEKQIHERFIVTQQTLSEMSSFVQEALGGVRILKSFAKEDLAVGRLIQLGRSYVAQNDRLGAVQQLLGPLMDFVMSMGLVVLLYFGGKFVIQDEISLGTWVAFQRYIQIMIWPMIALGLSVTYYQRAIASAKRLLMVLNEPEDPREKLVAGKSVDLFLEKQGQPLKVEFKNLTFSYPGSNRAVIRDFSLIIHPGERIALVGPVGSGKSTLIRILIGEYAPPAGTVFVDDIDITTLAPVILRKRVAAVLQDVFLMSDTVSQNIAYSKRSEFSEVPYRAYQAAIDLEIEKLESGYETLLGEKGVQLSGGQKQRVSIARALFARPDLLILDDSFSAVDVETERLLTERLKDRSGTEIWIAHRESTLRFCDRRVQL
jgi:ATP-binding cassette subfamily B protein